MQFTASTCHEILFSASPCFFFDSASCNSIICLRLTSRLDRVMYLITTLKCRTATLLIAQSRMYADGLTDVIYRLNFSSVFLTPYQSSVIVYCLVDLILCKTEIFHRVTKVFHFTVLPFTFWFSNLYKNVVQAVSTSIRVCRLFLHRIHFFKKTLSVKLSATQLAKTTPSIKQRRFSLQFLGAQHSSQT
jgi:hypothetical protein